MDEKIFIDRLTELRRQRNLSARSLSLQLCKSEGYIKQIENKKKLPSLDGFFDICKVLNISEKDFFDIEKNELEERISYADEETKNLILEILRKIQGPLK